MPGQASTVKPSCRSAPPVAGHQTPAWRPNRSHVERPIVVGHSWGGALALVYAINYPKEVAGVVLVAPAVYESQDGISLLTQLPAMPVVGDAVNSMLTPLFGASVVRSELKRAFSPDPVPKRIDNQTSRTRGSF